MLMKPLFILALSPLLFGLSAARAQEDPAYQPEYLQGNSFIYTSAASRNLNTATGAYIRFTATEDTSATSLHLYFNSTVDTSVTFGLQADNGSGAPSGIFLGSGTVSPKEGWNSLTLETPQALVAGQVYHVVALPTTGDTARLRRLVMAAPLTYQTWGIKDVNYGYGTRNVSGTPSAASNADAITFAIGTTSGRGLGLAYSKFSNSPVLSAATPRAQRFQFHATESGHNLLESITIRLSAGAADLQDVRITLLNDANLVLATSVIEASQITPSSTADYTATFTGGPVLAEGGYYRIALTAVGDGASSITWASTITESTNADINSATFQGVEGYAFSYSDATFATAQGISYGSDYLFSYSAVAVPEPGATAALAFGALVLGFGRRLRKPRA